MALLGSGGVVMASPNLSCASFGISNVLSSTNFCFLLNCNDGAIGGLIDFCAPTGFISFVGGRQETSESPFFSDCPAQ